MFIYPSAEHHSSAKNESERERERESFRGARGQRADYVACFLNGGVDGLVSRMHQFV